MEFFGPEENYRGDRGQVVGFFFLLSLGQSKSGASEKPVLEIAQCLPRGSRREWQWEAVAMNRLSSVTHKMPELISLLACHHA